MTKTQFIQCVSRECGVPQSTVRTVLNTMTGPDGVIVACMLQGDRLVLPGFGSFYTSAVRAHDRSHPGTQVPMRMLPKVRMRFKPGKTILRVLRELSPEDEE